MKARKRRPAGSPGRVAAGTGLLVAWLFAATAMSPAVPRAAGQAATCAPETEPNDVPGIALPVVDAGCHEGGLPEADAADLFTWTVSPEDAGRAWEIGLEGIPGAITELQLRASTTDPATGATTLGTALLESRTSPEQAGPVTSQGVLLLPGTYVVAVARSAGPVTDSGYRFTLRGDAVAEDPEPNDDDASGIPVAGTFEASGDLSGSDDSYLWTLDPEAASHNWTIGLKAPLGSPADLTIIDAAGVELAGATANGAIPARLHDLRLPAGTYQIRLPAQAAAPWRYVLSAAVEDDPAADPEPNDAPSTALPIAAADLVTGRLTASGERDVYRFSVDDRLAAVHLDAKLISLAGPARRLCLASLDAGGTERQLRCAEGSAPGAALRGLVLVPGDYLLIVMGEPSLGDPYHLRLDTTSASVADFEAEPNDEPVLATRWPSEIVMRGRLDQADVDTFRLRIGGEPQLWRVEALGEGLTGFLLVRADGSGMADSTPLPDADGRELVDLYLIPGEHWVTLQGRGEYRLRATALGPPDPDAEHEPNDDLALADPLPVGSSRTGRLRTGDRDLFRFSLMATDRVRISVQPPGDAAIAMFLEDVSGQVGQALPVAAGEGVIYDALLPPGDYALDLVAELASADPYRVSIERGDPLALTDDQEPNDTPSAARPMPRSLRVSGTGMRGTGGADWYRLEALPAEGQLGVRAKGASSVTLSDGSALLPLTLDGDGRTYRSPQLAAGTVVSVGVDATGPYTLSIDPGSTGLVPVPDPGPLPVRMELSLGTHLVAAFWPDEQRITGTLRLENTGAGDLDLALDAATSDARSRVSFDDSGVRVAGGATLELPVAVSVAPDARVDVPVQLTLRARDADLAQATVIDVITPARDVAPVAPQPGWPVPDALLGGLDVASLALGASVIPSLDPAAEARLHDGVSPLTSGMEMLTTLPSTLTVDLAGDEPVPVAGVILDPTAGPGGSAGVPRDVELLLSLDGVSYAVAMTGELSPAPFEQAFVLPAPVSARYAQLRITSKHGGGDLLRLGEWKVVAPPGWSPPGGGLDVADTLHGGHIVWMDPQAPDHSVPASMLDAADPLPQWLPVTPGTARTVTWVLGFHHERAARLVELRWSDPAASDPATRLERVDVAVSVDGPLGPWTDLGSWKLRRSAAGTVPPFVIPAPGWARFIRFEGRIPDPQGFVVELPAAIAAIEEGVDEGYRSIVGEWGQASPRGPFEHGQASVRSTLPEHADEPPDDDPVLAPGLAVGEVAAGWVARGDDVDWYRLTVPAGQRSLRLVVGGLPTVGVGLALVDGSGTELLLRSEPGSQGTAVYAADVEPGASYTVRVHQPPFSAVVTFDTSASIDLRSWVGMAQGLRAFTRGIIPGEEALQLLPFEADPLLDDFADDPWLLQNGLDRLVPVDKSSAETALIDAMELLEPRQGVHAILIMTDAETTSWHRTAELWRQLEAVRPRVFPVHVSGAESPVRDEDLMQDWAIAGSGPYVYARSGSAVEAAFERMATWLRRPAAYTLTYSASAERLPPPEPASLRVVAPPGPDGTRPPVAVGREVALEIILDTSGSMLERLGRKRRIDVAKRVLVDLVSDRIPPGTPVALRWFQQKRDSCDSELAVPLGPLDRRTMVATIRAVKGSSTVRTPLADAIAAVSGDLAGAADQRMVLVLTDGDESCGGDPKAAVEGLVGEGFDVTVNLVGIDLDSKSRRQMARLARAGHGTYVDADDAAELEGALENALRAPFRVFDAMGALVATGTAGGDAVRLTPGRYRVVVLSDPPATFEGVVLRPGGEVELTLPAR